MSVIALSAHLKAHFVQINPQFAENDVKIFRSYVLFSPTAGARLSHFSALRACPAPCLPGLLVPGIIVLM